MANFLMNVGKGWKLNNFERLLPLSSFAGMTGQFPSFLKCALKPATSDSISRPGRVGVEREKIVDCLLNPAHRNGASKARSFAGFGFRAEERVRLAEALREDEAACQSWAVRAD